jgi:putative membrane protein
MNTTDPQTGMNLSQSLTALTNGTAQLKSGAAQLQSGAAALESGVGQLDAGAIALKDGMVTFNETGIQKIANVIEKDGDVALETLKKVVELGDSYESFAGKSGEIEGSVKFIYRIEGITK